MATKTIEVMIGRKPDQPIDPEKIGRSVAPEPEVGGRDHFWRWVEFPCGHMCRIWYDSDLYTAYTCPICSDVYVF